MDGLNAIQAKILNEAKERAKEIALRAENYKTELIADAQKQKSAIIADAEEKANAQAEAMIKRAESMASMESRKSDLKARQDLITEVIEAALRKLSEKSDEEKITLYCELIKAHGIDKGEITLSREEQALGKALLERLGGGFSISEEPGTFTGGVIIKHGMIEDNLTFGLVVRNHRPDLSTLAASVLFQEIDNPAEQE